MIFKMLYLNFAVIDIQLILKKGFRKTINIHECHNLVQNFFTLKFLSQFHFLFFFLTAGCENGCSRHGQCTLEDGEYRCDCIEGWAGSDCSTPLEMNCNDGIDNDKGKHHFTIFFVTFFFVHWFPINGHITFHSHVPST